MAPPQYKLTYFANRGLAEPSRLVFAYAGVPYEDIRLNRADWHANNTRTQYPWGTLPVLEIDGKVLSKSTAILRYLAKAFNLAGDNDFEGAKCDEHVEAVGDLKKVAYPAFLEPDEKKKAKLIGSLENETIPKFLTQWEKVVKGNGGFLVGKKFSYADFCVAATLETLVANVDENLLDKYPGLKSHYASVFAVNGIKEWVAKRPENVY